MKITTTIRNRITEIIIGLILITISLRSVYLTIQLYAPHFNFHWLDGSAAKTFLSYCIGELFYICVGAMLLFRTYGRLPLKIAYCITGFVCFISSYGVRCLENYFSPYIIGSIPAPYMISYICNSLILGTAIVIGFMTLNRNMIWSSHKRLMICIYALTVLSVLMNSHDWTLAVIILLPLFMQKDAVRKDKRGFIGEISIISSVIVPMAISHLYKDSSDLYSTYVKIAIIRVSMYVFLLLAPLMVFERECGGNKAEEKITVENDVTHTL